MKLNELKELNTLKKFVVVEWDFDDYEWILVDSFDDLKEAKKLYKYGRNIFTKKEIFELI